MDIKKRDLYLQKKYGISLAHYETKLLSQKESCALCGKHKSNFKRSLHVDHNHKTGKVRGLVCFYCNRELIRRHNKETAARLKEYMDKYES